MSDKEKNITVELEFFELTMIINSLRDRLDYSKSPFIVQERYVNLIKNLDELHKKYR